MLAVATAFGCLYLLNKTDDDPVRSAASASTTVPRAPRSSTTSTTVPLAPGCSAFQQIRDHEEASVRVQDLLFEVYFAPEGKEALQAAIDALDQYVEDSLPAISDALGQVASELPDHREAAVLVRRFFVAVIGALEDSDDRDKIVRALEDSYTREDAEGAYTAIADFVLYDLEHCPQPAR